MAQINESAKREIAKILLKRVICLYPEINIAGIHMFKVKKPPIRVAEVGWPFQNMGIVLSSWAKPPSLKLRNTDNTAEMEKMEAI
ncbi:hypothetical protein H4O18_07705 [Arenibacter sp. BSSL-BM3]|uniref:Uncharacterized protein n=1 Tax=Arenibacter arenosicollis TaxID=2762274 RepID=A0ABR7QL03_9FLAO|nr:hypothetical protein [Arenibacter arenosicollis]MBC8767872.1 hypothetical protein [Arenibacter arenosicollis]